MLLQFLLKHGIDHRAPFRSRNRRIRHDEIIYALNGHSGATTQVDKRWSVCKPFVPGLWSLRRQPHHSGRQITVPISLDEDIVNRGVRFRQRAPAPAATRDETWPAGRPANRQDRADFAARQSPAQAVMEPCRSARLLLPKSLSEWPLRGLDRRLQSNRPAARKKWHFPLQPRLPIMIPWNDPVFRCRWLACSAWWRALPSTSGYSGWEPCGGFSA